jgi:hypothetical protein
MEIYGSQFCRLHVLRRQHVSKCDHLPTVETARATNNKRCERQSILNEGLDIRAGKEWESIFDWNMIECFNTSSNRLLSLKKNYNDSLLFSKHCFTVRQPFPAILIDRCLTVARPVSSVRSQLDRPVYLYLLHWSVAW